MNPVDLTGALARELIHDRMERARRSSLAALARCCQPSAWRQAFALAIAAARSRRHRPTWRPVVCCN